MQRHLLHKFTEHFRKYITFATYIDHLCNPQRCQQINIPIPFENMLPKQDSKVYRMIWQHDNAYSYDL